MSALGHEPRRDEFAACTCPFDREVECDGCQAYERAQSSYWREVDHQIDERRGK